MAVKQRVIRALEVYSRTGQAISAHHQGAKDRLQGFATLVIGISPDRTTLRRMIEWRTSEMFARGLLEAATLRDLFDRIRPDLVRFPAIDPAAFARRVEAVVDSGGRP